MDTAIKGLASVFQAIGHIDSGILGFILLVIIVVWAVSKAMD